MSPSRLRLIEPTLQPGDRVIGSTSCGVGRISLGPLAAYQPKRAMDSAPQAALMTTTGASSSTPALAVERCSSEWPRAPELLFPSSAACYWRPGLATAVKPGSRLTHPTETTQLRAGPRAVYDVAKVMRGKKKSTPSKRKIPLPYSHAYSALSAGGAISEFIDGCFGQ